MNRRPHPLWQLFLCRAREFKREPGALFWVFAFPLLISMALGLAFREQGPVRVDVAVLPGAGADEAVVRLASSRALKPVLMEEADARRALQGAKVGAILDSAARRIVVDEGQQNATLTRAAVEAALAGDAVLALNEERVQNVGSRYIDFLIPGVLGMSLMSSSIWGIGWSLVQLRTRKLLKRLMATPMQRRHLLLSFVLWRGVLAVLEVSVLTGFGVLVFGTPLRGSWLGALLVVAGGVLAFSGISLLSASRAQNEQTASGLMNLVSLPMSVMSGVFFSWERFPEWMHPVIRALPLTALNDGLRAVMNQGAGLFDVAPAIGVLAVWGVATFALALKVFRWL